ncbi:uncharacterized protein [Montipora capricornis]|uniref:uncharacterized protein isoform X1 n=1 Tax=Montipora capricornis TaxID=246305 RepID=UPI0035F20BFD
MGQLLLTEKFVGECVNTWSLVVFVENCNLNGTRPQSPAENSKDEVSYTVENTRHQNCLRQDILVENSTKERTVMLIEVAPIGSSENTILYFDFFVTWIELARLH